MLVDACERVRLTVLRSTASSASRTDSLNRASKVIRGTSSPTARAQRTSDRSCASAPSKRFTAITNGTPDFSK
jgi:hypothetical protein